MKKACLALVLAFSAVACSKAAPGDDAFKNDLTARGGIPDDSIKPKPGVVAPAVTPVAAPKPAAPSPVPIPFPNTNARGGIPDDSIKTAPRPLPAPNTRGGVADDGVKPAAPR